jgi:Ca-activated chloride channel family protein
MARALTLAAWVVVTALPASASEPGDRAQAVGLPHIEVTTITRVVDVYAIVRDARGRLITSLGKEQFELREDGVVQDVEYFSRETAAALSVGLAIDTSVSQAGILPRAREAARNFLRTLLRPSDRAFVMRFDRDVELLQGLTSELTLLEGALRAVHADQVAAAARASAGRPSGTRLYDAIRQACRELAGEKGRKVLVIVTDGKDQGSRTTPRAALDAAERAQVTLYTVIVADPTYYWIRGREFDGERAIASLARKTGGGLIPSDASGGLDDVAAELRAQYRLGYVPREGRFDGGFRSLDVRLRGVRYSVRARRGYYATAE